MVKQLGTKIMIYLKFMYVLRSQDLILLDFITSPQDWVIATDLLVMFCNFNHINIPCGRKPEYWEKTHDFQSVRTLFT